MSASCRHRTFYLALLLVPRSAKHKTFVRCRAPGTSTDASSTILVIKRIATTLLDVSRNGSEATLLPFGSGQIANQR
jgi:hypothetical protein